MQCLFSVKIDYDTKINIFIVVINLFIYSCMQIGVKLQYGNKPMYYSFLIVHIYL